MILQRWHFVALFGLLLGLAQLPVEASPGSDVQRGSGELVWSDLNPAFAGATFVNDKAVCAECHDEDMEDYAQTVHARTFGHGPKGALQSLECESCHGPRSAHVKKQTVKTKMSAEQYSAACLQCHEGGKRMHWKNSLHPAADVNCVSCHSVKKKRSSTALLAKPDEATLCMTCHTNVKSELRRASHHPVREDKMTCSDCHNSHGSPAKDLLKAATVNETCFACHQEKRGPFLFEHAPVRENCANCHTPHGSNNPSLLEAKASFGCLQCHTYGGHINLPRYNRTSNPYGQGCVNCHVTQHGSNSPSGSKFTR
jgi:DmsE family decaheme c-type cytochrome